MRWWVVALLLAAACSTAPPEVTRLPAPAPPPTPSEPLAAGLGALASGRYRDAGQRLGEARTRYPALGDYALYFQARSAARAGRGEEARAMLDELLAAHPDSIWAGQADLLAGELARAAGGLATARSRLAAARAALAEGSTGWARASLGLAAIESDAGSPAAALELANAVRRSRPRALAARRARRLVARLCRAHPELPLPDALEEAELRLREGDAGGAVAEAERALAGAPPDAEQARALWVRAQAERARGDRAAAEATCRALATAAPGDPLAPRALATAAGWRWNADDDEGAERLFREVTRRYPASPQAPEALYAVGRIAQEAGHYDEAFTVYTRLVAHYSQAKVADDAAWRAGWVRYQASEFALAERTFAGLAGGSAAGPRAAAEYWGARALDRLGREGEARERLARLAERHPTSYYAGLAEARLGRDGSAGEAPERAPAPPFPAELTGSHAERARLLADLGFSRFARHEIDALADTGMPREALVQAYGAVGAPGAALRLARQLESPEADGALRRYLYPLGYWSLVRPAARARGVDPFLVAALIRQESLFDPEAVSPADARGLMQLLPSTARELRRAAGAPPPPQAALHQAATNVDLGVTLLARLLERYGGSRVKALAAYNAGEDAVAKWERRYAGRDEDEFVELISFRETRDYVKAVLRNHRLYRQLYAEPPAASASATSLGSPPNAPFDMTTTTSPGHAEASR